MREIEIVRRLCKGCRGKVHAARFRAVTLAVDAIRRSQRISLTAIGRAVRTAAQPRHGIKMLDRLLGNAKLHNELLDWYAALVSTLVRGQRRVVVLVDWTQLHGDRWALVAGVPFLGRSLPILARTWPKANVGSRWVQARFIRELRRILPTDCRPIVVADGGFRSPFFIACQASGVDFVVRLRNDRAVVDDGFNRHTFAKIFALASRRARCLGLRRPYASSAHSQFLRLVLGPRPRKASKRHLHRDDFERKRGCEPLFLATSLDNEAAQTVVAIYEKRMQIEETFRDTKSPRFGWGLEHARTSSLERLDVLLLLTALAFAVTVLVGAAADHAGLERSLRASSRRSRVLSFFTLGNLLASTTRRRCSIRLHAIWKQLKRIRLCTRELFPTIAPPRSENRNLKLPLPHDLFCTDCGWNGAKFGWPP